MSTGVADGRGAKIFLERRNRSPGRRVQNSAKRLAKEGRGMGSPQKQKKPAKGASTKGPAWHIRLHWAIVRCAISSTVEGLQRAIAGSGNNQNTGCRRSRDIVRSATFSRAPATLCRGSHHAPGTGPGTATAARARHAGPWRWDRSSQQRASRARCRRHHGPLEHATHYAC